MTDHTFNPPPGWPSPPPGWVPPKGWVPDPSWPPAPDGWQWWLPPPTQPPAEATTEPELQATPAYGPGNVSFGFARYVQGHPDEPKLHSGNLILTSQAIGIGTLSPKRAAVPWPQAQGISFTGREHRKDGGDPVRVLVTLHGGPVVTYEVDHAGRLDLEGKVAPLLSALQVPHIEHAQLPTPQLILRHPPMPAHVNPTADADQGRSEPRSTCPSPATNARPAASRAPRSRPGERSEPPSTKPKS